MHPTLFHIGSFQVHTYGLLLAVGFLGKAKDLVDRHPDKVGPNVTANVKLGLTFSAADVAAAEARGGGTIPA